MSTQKEIINTRIEPEKPKWQAEANLSQYSSSIIKQKVMPPEEKKIMRCLQLLSELMKNSEKNGTRGVRPHKALLTGEWLT